MKRFFKKICLLLILVIFISIGSLIYNGYSLYKDAISETSIEEMVAEIKENTDNYTKYEDLPENYINAVVAVEDRRFFEHNGVDIVSILRAIATDIKTMSFAEGGSTITQQLAKNTYFTQKKQITRKIAEVFMAFQYEKECSKEEIFELYVNTMYFGDGYYSVYDAAQGYFDKNVGDMDLYECTLLAGIPNAPSVYSPTKNPELAKERQAQVLYKMVKYNYLTQEEADKIHDL
jgi:membrane peptidoglycan carboxypeptidase